MKSNNHTIARFRSGLLSVSGIAAVLALAAPLASAQDKATLDLLVQKGVITQADEDNVAKSAAAPIVVTPKDGAVKGLKLEGMIQAQFDDLSTKANGPGSVSPTSTDEFLLRRVYLGALADLGNGWNAEVLLDLAATDGSNQPSGGPGAAIPTTTGTLNTALGQNQFEKVIITKNFSDLDGTLGVGLRKVDFTQEEVTSSATGKVIERSVVSRFFDESYGTSTSGRLAFADRHTGIFWNGTIPLVPGLYYSTALTDGVQNDNVQFTNPGGLNRFGYWAALGYKGSIGGFKYDVGVNGGLSQDQNSVNASQVTPTSTVNQANTDIGYNPYVKLDVGNFELSAEFEQVDVDHGRGPAAAITNANTSRVLPYGFNITPSYKITPEWELVARYSYLDTDGRGVAIKDVARDGINIASTTLYNNVSSIYAGVNWYIVGTAVKWSNGYEFDDFYHSGVAGSGFTGPRAEVSGFRSQLQVTF